MTLRWLLAFLHLVALPIGVAAVYLRARALRALDFDRTRALAGGHRKADVVLQLQLALPHQMTALLLILLLEIRPIVVIGRWRSRLRKHQPIETTAAHAMMIAATGMTRGFGVFR